MAYFPLGALYPPHNGTRLTFLKGSTARIPWRFDGVSYIISRSWYFQGRDGSPEEAVALIFKQGDPVKYDSSLPGVIVEKPATLILPNLTMKYDGTYRFNLAAITGRWDSTVVVYIAGKFWNKIIHCLAFIALT